MWKNENPLPAGDPKKILKYALGIGLGLLVLWIFVLAQSDNRSNHVNIEDQERIDSLRVALGRDLVPVEERQSDGILTNAWNTFLILGGTIIIIWFFFRKKNAPQQPSNPVFRVVSRQSLPTGQEIQVIEINQEYWVLASTHQQVTLLHRYQKEEWDLIVTEENDDSKNSSFASLLSNFQKK